MNSYKTLCVWHIITSITVICACVFMCVCGFLLILEKTHPFAGWLCVMWNLGRSWDWDEGYGIEDNSVILSLWITLGILKYPFLGELDVLRELAPTPTIWGAIWATLRSLQLPRVLLYWLLHPQAARLQWCLWRVWPAGPHSGSMRPLGMDWQSLMTICW